MILQVKYSTNKYNQIPGENMNSIFFFFFSFFFFVYDV